LFWHIVRFDFTGVDEGTRTDIEDRLEGLDSLDEVAWLRLGHDVNDAEVTAFVTGFATREDYEAYRVHPDHVPVVVAIEAADVAATRIDFETDDEVEGWGERGVEVLP
jgi:hypothetical protein